jgi:hypothetical protein
MLAIFSKSLSRAESHLTNFRRNAEVIFWLERYFGQCWRKDSSCLGGKNICEEKKDGEPCSSHSCFLNVISDFRRPSFCSDETLTPLVIAVNVDSRELSVLVDADEEGREGLSETSGWRKSAANLRSRGSWLSPGRYEKAIAELQT